ncbi:hypothetical protein MMC12_000249 [Toensbergia leucococca]|nr:hypothetical protein [Toensbergia leucococca]
MPLSWLIPDDIRNRATRLAGNCVGEFDGIGGFEVLDLAHLVSWAVTVPPPIPPWHNPPPVGATFATITISGPSNKMFSPGNTDPAIAFAVADALATIYGENDIDLHSQRLLLDKEHYWRTVGEQMDRGGTTPWWQAAVPQASAETVYECDASLGSPSLADCSQIEWSQLGPFGKVSDSIQIEPGAPTFLHSNTCYLAISATAPLVLTWQQIRAAVATLMGICLENPYQSSQGGRAYFGSQLQQPNGRKAKAKRQNGGLLGLNALPPNANITIFRQLEPWTNPINEIETCAWQAVKIGASVMGCKVI